MPCVSGYPPPKTRIAGECGAYVRSPAGPDSSQPKTLWVARRKCWRGGLPPANLVTSAVDAYSEVGAALLKVSNAADSVVRAAEQWGTVGTAGLPKELEPVVVGAQEIAGIVNEILPR